MSVQIPPPRTCVVQCLTSDITERTFLVISRQFLRDFEDAFAAQGIELRYEELPYRYTEPEQYERVYRALRHITAAVGLPMQEGESILPALEKAAALLRKEQQP